MVVVVVVVVGGGADPGHPWALRVELEGSGGSGLGEDPFPGSWSLCTPREGRTAEPGNLKPGPVQGRGSPQFDSSRPRDAGPASHSRLCTVLSPYRPGIPEEVLAATWGFYIICGLNVRGNAKVHLK